VDSASTETGFVLQRAVGGGSFSDRVTLGTNVTTFTDTGLAGSTTYHYRVRAYNGAGASAYSNLVSVTTPAGLATPTSPSPAAVAVSGSTVGLSWTKVSGATAYDVQREVLNPKNRKWTSTLMTVGGTATTLAQTVGDGTYRYRVRASNTAGVSSYATASCATCASDGSFTVSTSSSAGSPSGSTGKDKK
jgi:hypothetical protein